MNALEETVERVFKFQYRKRYGLHAIRKICFKGFEAHPFQYRKRYGLHAIVIQIGTNPRGQFQYRKRYGLHAITHYFKLTAEDRAFQYRKRYGLHAIKFYDFVENNFDVSIPQAVWIACNEYLCGNRSQ